MTQYSLSLASCVEQLDSIMTDCGIPCAGFISTGIEYLHVFCGELKVINLSILFDSRLGDRLRQWNKPLFCQVSVFSHLKIGMGSLPSAGST